MEATEKEILHFSKKCDDVFKELARDIIGQRDAVENIVIALIAGGNVLLEGVPGTGKTRLVRSVGRVFGLPFSRIQFTPDLMPADVTGTNIIEKDANGNSVFRFHPGPIFSNIVLADEINRATPKTQSALLEAMQEHMVSVAGKDYRLEEPFFVLATQNPVEQEGTYELPEAQTDRFMFKLVLQYPSVEELKSIVLLTQYSNDEVAQTVITAEEMLRMRAISKEIPVADSVLTYAMTLVAATQPESDAASETAKHYLRMGASPRAGQALISAARIQALIHGKYNVSYENIDSLAYPVLRHRVKLNFDAISQGMTADRVIENMVKELGELKKPRRRM